MDPILHAVLLGALVPGALAGAAFLLGGRPPWRLNAFGLAGAYVIGHGLVAGWPPIPPRETTHWIPILALLGAVAGLTLTMRPSSALHRLWAALLVVATSLWLTARPLYAHSWGTGEAVAWSAGLGLAWLIWWTVFTPCASRSGGPWAPAALACVAAVSAGACVFAGTAKLGQLCGVLAAGLGAAAAVSLVRKDFRLGAAAAPVVAVLLPVLWLNAYFYAEDLPTSSLVLLALASLGPRMLELPAWQRSPVRKVAALALGTALPALLALFLAWRVWAESAEDSYY